MYNILYAIFRVATYRKWQFLTFTKTNIWRHKKYSIFKENTQCLLQLVIDIPKSCFLIKTVVFCEICSWFRTLFRTNLCFLFVFRSLMEWNATLSFLPERVSSNFFFFFQKKFEVSMTSSKKLWQCCQLFLFHTFNFIIFNPNQNNFKFVYILLGLGVWIY